MIATAHSSLIQLLNSNVMCVHASMVIHGCLLDALKFSVYVLRYDREKFKCLCLYKAGAQCPCNAFKHSYMDLLTVP